jgi:hypothetical protein
VRARDRLAARLYLQEDAYPVTFGLRDPAVSTADYADFADFLCVVTLQLRRAFGTKPNP